MEMPRLNSTKSAPSARIAAIRAACRAEPMFAAGSTPRTAPAPAATAQVVAHAPAKPKPLSERSPEYRAAYNLAFAKRSAETLATIATVQASALYPGREKLALTMIGGGATAQDVIAALAILRVTNPTAIEAAVDKRAAIAATWDRAHAKVDDKATAILAAQRKAFGGPVGEIAG